MDMDYRKSGAAAAFLISLFLAASVAHGAKPLPAAGAAGVAPDACPADVVKQTPLAMVASGASEVARGDVITFTLQAAGTEEELETSQTVKNEAAVAKANAATALLECLNAKSIKEGKHPKLLLNGIALGSGAKLINKTDWSRGEITYELVTALPVEASKKDREVFADFWKAIYREAGWTDVAPQRTELQIDGLGTIARGDMGVVAISGSPESRRNVAAVAAALIAMLFVWAIGSNKIFRDEAPAWIEKARSFESVRKSTTDWGRVLAEHAAALGISAEELTKRAREIYKAVCEDTTLKSDDDIKLAAIGSLIDSEKAPEVSYSLSRVQLGAWLVVTVIGGLVIWVYQGARPVIPLTYLAMLGISGGTRLLSDVVDSGKGHAVGGVHKSFFTDLTAGTNGGGVHRYQAMMINIVLLTTVAFEIIGTLAFPEIDDSWLTLLLGSSGVYLAAKKSGETPPVKPS